MRNFTIIIFLLASINIFAQTTSIPDANFEQALIDLGYDTGTPDGTVPTANISVLTSLDVFQKNISDLTGIEDFISLTNLNCSLNQLTSLDVTQNISLTNLSCFGNQITDLDFTQNTSLTELMCNSNQLTSLNLTQNTSLDKLFCHMNQLTSLDVSMNTSLIELVCFNNQLTSLNVKNGNNANITNFYADNNPNLTCIFVDDKDATYLNDWTKEATATFVETEAECDALQTTSIPDANFEQALIDLGYDTGTPDGTVPTANISGLTSLDVANKNIADLTGIEDFTSLTSLVCGFNQLTSIDVSSNTDLTVLNCFENKLINLNVQNGNNINFTYFSAEQNANLGCIFVDDKNASYLSNWEKDENANFVETQEDCDNVYTTYVPDNNFEQALIDLGYDSGSVDNYVPTTNIIGLSQLNIANKNISDLTGIEDFKNLTDLDCSSNQLTFLQFNNSNLINLDCSSNQLTELNLPSNSDLTNLNCSSNQLTELWIYGNTSLSSINCSDNLINDFIISENTPLMNLNISLNELTNLSTNIYSVEQLNCSHNEISNLDILSFCSELNYLDCSYNQLTNLNISENMGLTSLNCSNNQVLNVDITANISLTSLKCFSNQLTSLNVQNGNNSNFIDFDAHDNPNLTCIFVDDKDATYLNDWTKDATSTFVETEAECDALTTVKDIKNSNFIIYPNPTKEIFSIKTDNKINEVKIYDVFGKLVEVFDSNENYNVSSFAKGIYLVYVKSEDGVMISKLIIE